MVARVRARLARFLELTLRVRPAELPPVALLFSWFFCLIGAIWLSRTVRDSLFLANVSAAGLPRMYILSPLTLSAVGFTYARFADRVRRDRLVVVTPLLVGALLILFRGLVGG